MFLIIIFSLSFTLIKSQHVPRSSNLLQDVLASTPTTKHHEVLKKYSQKQENQGFHREYHCSERTLYSYLNQPEIIQEIIDTIEIQCAIQTGLKIYSMIINIHTTHY